MLNIFGINIPDNKPVRIGLTTIYGIGFKQASDICDKIGISPSIRIYQLKDFEIHEISKLLKNSFLIEGDLRKETHLNIKRLVNISSYRGVRHRLGLPVRGQRTHTNARTRKYKKVQSFRNYSTGTKKVGIAHIKSTFNNTIITITSRSGNTICWSSGGYKGVLKGAKRSTAYAGQTAGFDVGKRAKAKGLSLIEINFKGFGRGRNSAIKGLLNSGLRIVKLTDKTPLPHNGCRPKKRRRI